MASLKPNKYKTTMKQTLTILLSFFLLQSLFSQEFEVREFIADPSDLAARRYEKRTVNDEPCAIVKVITNIQGMRFDSNIGIVDVEHKEEGYWLYIAPRERRIRLLAEDYLAKDVEMPEPAQPHTVYSMIVVTKGMLAPPTDLVRVTFRMNEDNVYIRSGDRAPVLARSSNAVFDVPKVEQTFRFIKNGFAEVEKTIDVQDEQVINIELVPGEPTTRLSLPGIVIIESDPPGAEVFLNEQRIGTTPYQGQQIAGQYNLMLRFPMYNDHTEQFNLDEGATLSLPTVELKPRFGYWTVNSTPTGAEVLLNNREMGTTPLERGQISSGTHELTVRKSLYHEHTEHFTIEDGDDKTFNIELKEAFGQLTVTSDPSGADVYIDSRKAGTTPYNNPQQPSGRYSIRVSKDLYSDARDQVTVSDGEKTERFIPLNKNYGTLNVEAEGAQIFISGRREGTGRISRNLSAGRYNIKATKERHDDDEREVFITVGQTENITLSPKPREGALSIVTEPFESRGAEIYINDKKRRETTPAVLPLLEGEYKVSVKKRGYLDASKTISIRQARQHELVFDMQTFEGSQLQQARRHKTAKILYGTAAFTAVGAGAYFQLSSMQLADDYKTATTDATEVYDRMEQHQLISYIAFGAAVPLGVMMFVQSFRQKQTERKVNLSALPVKDGAVFGLVIKF